MAGQRRGEPGGDAPRGGNRPRRLVALLLATGLALGAAAGCDAGVRVAGFGTAGGTGGGTSGAGSGASALLGTWRNLSSLVLSTGETVVFDVRWRFGAGCGFS